MKSNNHARVRDHMAVDILDNISLLDHYFLSFYEQGEDQGLCRIHLRLFHEVNNHTIYKGIESEYIYNMDKTSSGQNSRTKMVIGLQGLRNMWGK